METIFQQAKKYAKDIFDNIDCDTDTFGEEDIIKAVQHGVNIAQYWISVNDKLPERISIKKNQLNGNVLFFYKNYIVKGIINNESQDECILMATYKPSSISWYFNIHYPFPSHVKLNITHWRPIELN